MKKTTKALKEFSFLKKFALEHTENSLERRIVIANCYSVEDSLEILRIIKKLNFIKLEKDDEGNYYLLSLGLLLDLDKEDYKLLKRYFK